MKTRSLLLACVLLLACRGESEQTGVDLSDVPPQGGDKVTKNVILFIGDGMGPGQIGLMELYARKAPKQRYGDRKTAFERLADEGVFGMSMHQPLDRLVVDSACSATQLATGRAAPSEVIGVGPKGEDLETVLERAESKGKATGLVSDTRITHATPASFAAAVRHRNLENDIALQLLESDADVLLSGGRRHFLPKEQKGKRSDGRNLLDEAKQAGWTVLESRAGLDTASGRVLGLFAMSGMYDGITDHKMRKRTDRAEPTLLEMTQNAVRILEADDDGFFLMVEAGQIDWAGHANDAGWMLHEMEKADETLHWLLDYAVKDGETLLVVTADHETGGFGFSYSRAGLPNKPLPLGGVFTEETPYQPDWNFGPFEVLDMLYDQQQPFERVLTNWARTPEKDPAVLAQQLSATTGFAFDEEAVGRILASEPNHYRVPGHGMLDVEDFPEFHDFEAYYPYGEIERSDLVAREMTDKTHVVWSTGTHTHIPVPVYAYGAIAGEFDTMHHHTDIGRLLMKAVSE